jgi:membrane fusion protein YbhG
MPFFDAKSYDKRETSRARGKGQNVKRTPWILGIGLAAVAAVIGLWIFWPFGGNGDVLRFPGTVEIQEVRMGSKVGGRVKEVRCSEGDEVLPGQVLVVFDVPELEAQRAQLEAKVEAARAELDKANYGPRREEKDAARAAAQSAKARFERAVFGWREEEKEQAKEELATAKADLKRAEEDFTRVDRLYQERSASRAEYDAAFATRDMATGRFNAAKAKSLMMQRGTRPEDIAEARAEWEKAQAKSEELENGTRPEDIELAKAQFHDAQAKLREVNVNIAEREVRVPKELGRARVQVLAVRPGDLVPANQPVVRVLREEDQWVRFYVPETELGKMRVKQTVDVTTDAYPSKRFKGTVDSINPFSEFTPRNIQTRDERRHQVFGVKIKIDNTQGLFHAGMAADVLVPVTPP